MNPIRTDVDISSLVNKLGHEVEEIRIRALDNMLSKLELKVLVEEDLVQERFLLIRLLEWFNFPTVSKKREVSEFLKNLSEHTSAAELLRDLGAIEFLSEMRPDCDDEIQPLVDQILDHLFRLPIDAERSPIPTRKLHQACQYQHKHLEDEFIPVREEGMEKISPILESPQGYFPVLHHVKSISQTKKNLSTSLEGMRGIKFSTFPWLTLTATDKHVLISTNSSLSSPRQDMVLTSCDFLTDVVFQDFPAEVFLQRPSIVRSLLAIQALRPPHIQDSTIVMKSLHCLTNLSHLLLVRYNFYHDPELYCPKQDFGSPQPSIASSNQSLPSQSTGQSNLSYDSRPSVIGRNEMRIGGDGRDWDSPSSGASMPGLSAPAQGNISPSSDMDSEDMVSLQFAQITLPQFCIDVLHGTLSIWKYFNSLEVSAKAAVLLWEISQLMDLSLSSEVWSESGLSGRALMETLNESLDLLGDIICQESQTLTSNAELEEHTLVQHRNMFMSLAAFAVTMVTKFVPVDMVSSVIPESLCTSMYLILMDPMIGVCWPDMQPKLLPFFTGTNEQQVRRYQETKQVAHSITQACRFLVSTEKEPLGSELIQLADEATYGAHFTDTLPLIDKFVRLGSALCSRPDVQSSEIDSFRKTLIKYLQHPVIGVQTSSVSSCFAIVAASLNVANSADPSSRASRNVRFLLDQSVLKVFAEGLSHKDKKIIETCEAIFVHLLNGELLMQQSIWEEFLYSCLPHLSLLQAFASISTSMYTSLKGLLTSRSSHEEHQSASCRLPRCEQLRIAVRFLLAKNCSEEKELSRFIHEYLHFEEDKDNKLPSLVIIIPEQISMLLRFEHSLPLDEDTGRSVFEVDSLVQMMTILKSSSSDIALKRSAATQVAIILQDILLHEAFLNQDGLEMVLKIVRESLSNGSAVSFDESTSILPPCLKILRQVVQQSPSVRHQLAHQTEFYLALIRCGLLFLMDDNVRYDLGHLFTLLVFDEVAQIATIEDEQHLSKFTLPHSIKQGYQLPYRCQTTATPKTKMKIPQLGDLSQHPLPMLMIKVSWLITLHGGIDECIAKLLSGRDLHPDERSDLKLSRTEELLLIHSHPSSAIKTCLQAITKASSHYEVKQVLWRLSHWLMVDSFILNGESDQKVPGYLLEHDLVEVFGRFLDTIPGNEDDISLLRAIITFLNHLLTSCKYAQPLELMVWLKSQLHPKRSPILSLLEQSTEMKPLSLEGRDSEKPAGKSGLIKQLFVFATTLIQQLPQSSEAWRLQGEFLGCGVVDALLHGLHLADEFDFYDLPSLEGSLVCMMHVTARPGWSLDWSAGDSFTLCQQLLKSLLEVVSAFHIGRGGIAMSYMGKGVTRNATLCLLHVSHEMQLRAPDENWCCHWLHDVSGTSQPDLQWLTSLWSYRDPEVRAAGLGITAALASTTNGCIMVALKCHHLPGGLWTAIFNIIMDHTECSVVRQQAVNLLANLLSHPFKEGKEGERSWMGPWVQSSESQMILSGIPALVTLLHLHQFFPNVSTILSYYYPECTIQPVSVVDNSTIGSSSQSLSGPSTLTTPDFSDNEAVQTSIPPNRTTAGSSQMTSPMVSEQSSTVPLIPARMKTQGGAAFQSPSSSSGPIHAGDVNHSTSHTSGYRSVATPGLLEALYRLLTYLEVILPEEVIVPKWREEVMGMNVRILDPQKVQTKLKGNEVKFSDLQFVSMCERLLRLMTSWASKCQGSHATQHQGKILSKACYLLHIQPSHVTDSVAGTSHLRLVESCFRFISVNVDKINYGHLSGDIMQQHWAHFVDITKYLLKTAVPCSTRVASLHCMASLLTRLHQMKQAGQEEDTERLNQVLDSATMADDSTCSRELTQILIQAYDGVLPQSLQHTPQEKGMVILTLSCLVVTSHAAKKAALEAGFVESLIDDLKHCHSELAMDPLQILPKGTAKTKQNNLLKKVQTSLELLHNLMYEEGAVKVCACQAGLTLIINKLWAWLSATDKKLLRSTLSLLAVYITRCPLACTSVAKSSSQPTSTLLHCLIKLADKQKFNSGKKSLEQAIHTKVFEVLACVAWSAECRSILWKSGFLENFTRLIPPSVKEGRTPTMQHSTVLWLKFLINLTFAKEGQQAILKISGSLSLLLEFGQCSEETISRLAVLVLHNLCFLGANKQKLLANDKLLPLFLKKLQQGSIHEQFAVTSAMWNLLYGNQKAKTILKTTNIHGYVRTVQESVKNDHQKPCLDASREEMLLKLDGALKWLLQLLQD